MKKNKFLSGLGAKLALAVVALTTAMFTSCSNEDIEFGVTTVPAKIYIEVSVFDATAGRDVTNEATVNINGKLEGTPALDAQDITVTATYNGMTGTKTVKAPAVAAFGSWSKSVAIVLADNDLEVAEVKYYESSKEVTKLSGYQDNLTDYCQYTTVTYPFIKGTKLIDKDYKGSNAKVEAIFKAYDQVEENPAKVSDKIELAAHGRLTATVTKTKATIVYQVKQVKDNEIVANFTVEEYDTTMTTETTDIPGHGHSHGHGHGHGHGDDSNAGGGIIIGE